MQFEAIVAALEDKIVQAAVVAILTPVYEAEFLSATGSDRSATSQALDALAFQHHDGILGSIATLQSFFKVAIGSTHFVEHRIGDQR